MQNINTKAFVLANRRKLYKAVLSAGLDPAQVYEKVDRRFPYGNWRCPVQVWTKDGIHLANYWLTYPRGKPPKFNLSTFEAIAKTWLKKPQLPLQNPSPSTTTADLPSS